MMLFVQNSPKRVAVFAACAALMWIIGCNDSDDGGGAGTGGSGGSGGAGGNGGDISVVVPQCVASAYQIVFRAFVEPMDPLLRYMDTPLAQRTSPDLDIPSLVELKDVPDVYSRFTWNADDVPDVSDPGGTLITADFVESSGLNPADLDDGIGGVEVVLVPWEMTVGDSTVVGAGKMSVIALDEDTVRITIVDFNPWYEGWANYCRFEISAFDLALDLATPGSDPFSVVVGYTAQGNGYAIEAGWISFGVDTASFAGNYKLGSAAAIPFDFDLDYSTDPASIEGTFGGIPATCTIDLDTFAVTC